MRYLDAIDKEIIRVLYNEGIPLTISEVSKKANLSWVTVKSHAEKLSNLKIVEMTPTTTRKLPKLILDFSFIQQIFNPSRPYPV
ncbi:MAG: Lrp/AsnC family transcriptional regulator [Candidatus Woesearchaeota archaeon]|jgi:Mn-dependent DtxR family transcriptional regulator